jgi:hypothetical protein
MGHCIYRHVTRFDIGLLHVISFYHMFRLNLLLKGKRETLQARIEATRIKCTYD